MGSLIIPVLVKVKMQQIPEWLQWSADLETIPQVPKVASGSGLWVLRADSSSQGQYTVPQVAAVWHEGL